MNDSSFVRTHNKVKNFSLDTFSRGVRTGLAIGIFGVIPTRPGWTEYLSTGDYNGISIKYHDRILEAEMLINTFERMSSDG